MSWKNTKEVIGGCAFLLGWPIAFCVFIWMFITGMAESCSQYETAKRHRHEQFEKQCFADGKSKTDCAVLWGQVK